MMPASHGAPNAAMMAMTQERVVGGCPARALRCAWEDRRAKARLAVCHGDLQDAPTGAGS